MLSLPQSCGVTWGYEWSKQPDLYPRWVPTWLMKTLGDDFFGNVIAINFDVDGCPVPVRESLWSDEQFARLMKSVEKLPLLQVVGFGDNTTSEAQLAQFQEQFPRIRIIRGGFGPDSGQVPF